jgi:hypothetical protein
MGSMWQSHRLDRAGGEIRPSQEHQYRCRVWAFGSSVVSSMYMSPGGIGKEVTHGVRHGRGGRKAIELVMMGHLCGQGGCQEMFGRFPERLRQLQTRTRTTSLIAPHTTRPRQRTSESPYFSSHTLQTDCSKSILSTRIGQPHMSACWTTTQAGITLPSTRHLQILLYSHGLCPEHIDFPPAPTGQPPR